MAKIIAPFSKTFPKNISGSNFPVWEEVTLNEDEEKKMERLCREENFQVLDSCLGDAKSLAIKHGINTDENQVRLAIALFEKLVSHVIFWKESKAKEKFNLNAKS